MQKNAKGGMMRHRVALIFSIFFIVNCQKEIKEIRIGVIGPMKKKPGIAIKHASILAKEEINQKGGISYKISGESKKLPIKLIFIDDHYNKVSKASVSLRKAIEKEKPHFLVGGHISKVVVPLMDIMAENKILWFVAGGASSKVIQKVESDYEKYKYYFRCGSLDASYQGKSIAEFSKALLLPKGLKRVAFVGINHAYSKYVYQLAHKHMKNSGFEFVYIKFVDPKIKDFTDIFKKLKKVDFVFTVMLSKESYLFLEQAKKTKLNMKIPIFGVIAPAFRNDFYQETKGSAKWVTVLQSQAGPVDRSGTGKVFQFIEQYQKRFKNEPFWGGYPTYDSVYLIKDLIEKTRSINPEKIIKFIQRDDYEYVGMTRLKWYKNNHDLYVGKHGGKMYSFIAWFQFFPDGKRYAVFPVKYKTKNFMIPKK